MNQIEIWFGVLARRVLRRGEFRSVAELAQRIVEYRTSNGPFQSAEDLRKVKGIGAALFTKIAPLVTIEQ